VILNTVHRFSIWEIAHRWQNLDPESTDPKKLPLVVQDTLRSLAGAYHYDDLMIVNSKGVENKGAYHEPTQHRYKHEEIEEGLGDCNQRKIFNKPLLESVLSQEVMSLPAFETLVLMQNHFETPIRARAAAWFKDAVMKNGSRNRSSFVVRPS